MLHLTQNTRQTLGVCWPGWWPGAVPVLVSMWAVSGYLPRHRHSCSFSVSGPPLSLHCPGQLNTSWMAEGVSPLWSVQLSLLLPSFLWFVSESRNARQQRGNRGMLPRRLVSQQLLLCPLVSSLSLFLLDKILLFSLSPHIPESRLIRHCDSWCNMTCVPCVWLVSAASLIRADHVVTSPSHMPTLCNDDVTKI